MNRTMEEDLDSVLQMSLLGQPYGYGLKREDIIGWYYRWAGRPTREQIIEALKIGGGIIKGVNENSDIRVMSHGGWNIEQLVDSLLALYPALPVQKRVSRMQVEAVIAKHSKIGMGYWKQEFVDDLLSLLGQEEPSKPIYCSCYPDYSPGTTMRVRSFTPPTCDICSREIKLAPRPTD